VFYNPAMAGDRDLAVAFVRAWFGAGGGRSSGWEVAAATGVRGLRLLHEGERFDRFFLTEANDEAARVLSQNAARFPGASVEQRDGRTSPSTAPFDYVDVDPYGTPAPFIAGALGAVRPGGVLAVTATDMMVLAGVQRGACERRYEARPIRGRLSPEGGLRILLAYLAREARRQGRSVRPLLAYTRDHHVRAFLEVTVATDATPPAPVGLIDPATWTGPPVGDQGPYGPLWLGPLFDAGLVRSLVSPPFAARPRETETFLARLREETTADVPFYYESNRLTGELGLSTPPGLPALLEGLRGRGFRAARTHARPEGFRTDAPRAVVESVVRSLA
jgi:tRNA (guanine26-N2/guanine27-N2)-dimethyltransferase